MQATSARQSKCRLRSWHQRFFKNFILRLHYFFGFLCVICHKNHFELCLMNMGPISSAVIVCTLNQLYIRLKTLCNHNLQIKETVIHTISTNTFVIRESGQTFKKYSRVAHNIISNLLLSLPPQRQRNRLLGMVKSQHYSCFIVSVAARHSKGAEIIWHKCTLNAQQLTLH